MKILITGVAGLLGSRLADWILRTQCGVEVVGVDDLSCGYRENVPDGVQFIRHQLGADDMSSFDAIFEKVKPSIVYHFAAYAAEGLSPFIRGYNYRNNLIATAEVVNACVKHDVDRLVFTSSMAVYGRGLAPFDERDHCVPIDPYGVAKRAAEEDIRCAGEHHGLNWTIIRPHNVYGPGQSIWQRYRNVLGIWMERALRGEPLLIYGDGLQRRAFSYVDDCLAPLWRAGVSPGTRSQIINLGGTKAPTILEAANIACDVIGSTTPLQPRIEHREPRHEVKVAWCTWDKSVDLLDYQDSTALRDGLERMWHWACDAWERYPERRESHAVAPIELEKGLYPYWKAQQ